MKNLKINAAVFLLAIYVLMVINFLQINNEGASALAALENRATKTMPNLTKQSFFSGAFFRDFDDYFADTFVYRNNFIKVSNRLKQFRGINSSDAAEIIAIDGINVAERLQVARDDSEAEKAAEDIADEQLLLNNKFGEILIVNDSAMEIHFFNEAASNDYANSINFIQEQLPGDVKVYSMLIPTQIEFIKNKNYKDISYSQLKSIKFVNSKFNEKIIPVNVYDVLQKHADEYIYFRTDHHWTALGAYYAYTEFMKINNDELISLTDYEVIELHEYLGSIYSATLSEKLKNNPDTIQVFIPFSEHEFWIYYDGSSPIEKGKAINVNHIDSNNKYGVFLSGDFPLGKISTENKNGRKIVIIKDSYANAFIPFLIPHYEEIYIIDPRMYEGNLINFVRNNEIREVLFLNYVLVNRYDGYSKLFMEIATN